MNMAWVLGMLVLFPIIALHYWVFRLVSAVSRRPMPDEWTRDEAPTSSRWETSKTVHGPARGSR